MMTHTAVAFGDVGEEYAEAVEVTQRARIIFLANGTNAGVILSFDAGTSDSLTLDAGEVMTIDLGANQMTYSGAIHQKRESSAPTTGSLYIRIVHE